MTRPLPRTLMKASRKAWGDALAPVSSLATSESPAGAERPMPPARPTSRCSVETYSSSISVASACAALIAARDSRDNCGCEVAPLDDGSRSARPCASARMVAGLTPTASSRGPAIPSVWLSSASNRCAGLISGLPAALAACNAAVSAAWVFVVGLNESTTPPSRL